MSRFIWNADTPHGQQHILSGNEATARGALEAGVQWVASYPGSPSVQIVECLAAVADQRNLYVEWSINEKVALEVTAAGSFTGLRALSVMKADGLNVALDFLTTLPLSGIRGGLVVVVSDDPGAHSSIKEQDSRYLAVAAHVPLLEPADPQEAKEMLPWAFDISETLQMPVIVRLVTRICHARSNVSLGAIETEQRTPRFDKNPGFITAGRFHLRTHERLLRLQPLFDQSHFNSYTGPRSPELTLITNSVSYHYTVEAIERLQVEQRVGILKLGTVWPLPEALVLKVLKRSSRVIFFEEIEPFLEDQVKALAAAHLKQLPAIDFYGKQSGHVPWVAKPRGIGELDPDIVTQALAAALGLEFELGSAAVRDKLNCLPDPPLPGRLPNFCAGCPHRASYWAIKNALSLDGRQGIVLGDIGCYALGVSPTGYQAIQTVHCMGAGVGLASGFGKLSQMGYSAPTLAVIGDSTFYHSGIPALINAKATGARYLCILLDNGTTAMTGHQPHPGSGCSATGEQACALPFEPLLSGLDIPVTLADPFDVDATIQTILDLINENELHVLVLQRACALQRNKTKSQPRVRVDPQKCLGDDCGCNRFCSRVFACPANVWDETTGQARIDEVVCTGCGVCAQLCPQNAIIID